MNIQNNSYSTADANNHVYTVSVDAHGHEATDCTCPAAEYRSGKCKHQRAVENNAAVMAAAAPDVREADGGSLADDITAALARSFTLGVDSKGRSHYYYRPADSMVVYTEDGVVTVSTSTDGRSGSGSCSSRRTVAGSVVDGSLGSPISSTPSETGSQRDRRDRRRRSG